MMKTLRSEYAVLLAEKKQTYAEYRQARDEMRQLLKAKANVELLLSIEDNTSVCDWKIVRGTSVKYLHTK